MTIAHTILESRTHPKPVTVFSKRADPVLESVFQLLARQRYHFTWTRIVVLGCSAGGDVALRTLFKNVMVPHLPILVAMHHHPGFRFMTKFEMANSVSERIVAARDGESIRGSRLYFLPAEMETGFGLRTTSFSIRPAPFKRRFRPDINKIFSEAGIRFRENSLGVILSGMLDDGAEGAKAMALNGGEVWVQNPSSALFKEMPNAALEAVPSASVSSLGQIADRINQLSRAHLAIEPIGSSECG